MKTGTIPLKGNISFSPYGKQNNGWISVKDRLPEINVNVLIYCYDEYVVAKLEHWPDVDDHNSSLIWKFNMNAEGDFIKIDEVTHWQPLPEPPKEVL